MRVGQGAPVPWHCTHTTHAKRRHLVLMVRAQLLQPRHGFFPLVCYSDGMLSCTAPLRTAVRRTAPPIRAPMRVVAMAKKDDKGKSSARGPGSAPMYMETIEQRKASKAFRKGGADDGGRGGGGGGGGGDDGDDGGWNSGDGDGEVRHPGCVPHVPCENLGGSCEVRLLWYLPDHLTRPIAALLSALPPQTLSPP